jgi:ribulose-phosphate 3-epimerase
VAKGGRLGKRSGDQKPLLRGQISPRIVSQAGRCYRALMSHPIQIIPSILAADYARLGEEVVHADRAGGDRIHLDMIDGHVYKNMSFGPNMFQALRPFTTKPFDVHLMATPAREWIEPLKKAGCDRVMIQVGLENDLSALIKFIHAHAMSVGLVLTPRDEAEIVIPHLDMLDLINVMTVDPGFGGQRFLSSMMPKVSRVRDLIGARPIDLSVDGGITPETAPLAARAGATSFVAGTAIFKTPTKDYATAIHALRESVQSALSKTPETV